MFAKDFIDVLNRNGIDYFTGVPDSLLNAFCFDLLERYGKNGQFQVGVNEGNCVAFAAGHYIATGRVPCVFMQNSGIGNAVNPLTSLTNDMVYSIPSLLVVGWRGEPDVHDEPQHVFMGGITLKQLQVLGVEYAIIDSQTDASAIDEHMRRFCALFKEGKTCAFVVRKGTFRGNTVANVQNGYEIVREKAIEHIVGLADERDLIVSSTGKISRELFEIRERNGQKHNSDFLTVGSMGFASSIALKIAQECSDRRVICIDGDGAALMHLGAMAVAGQRNLSNFVHVIIDNEAHETVGGIPTVSGTVDWAKLAQALNYNGCSTIRTYAQLNDFKKLTGGALIVIKTNKIAREDLGRPTLTAKENITNFMNNINKRKG